MGEETAATECCSNQLWEMLHKTVQGLKQSFQAATTLATVRRLLEMGDMVTIIPFLQILEMDMTVVAFFTLQTW